MKIDPQKTAFLTLDLQKGVFGFLPGSERVMSVAAKAVAFARQNQFRIIHVGVGFSEGHPEIPDVESLWCGSNKTIFSSRALPPWNFTAIFFIRRTW